MTTLAANSTVTLALTDYDSVTISCRGPVIVEAVSGLGLAAGKMAEFDGTRTFGPFTAAGSLKLTTQGSGAQYEVADGATPGVPALLAIDSLTGQVAGIQGAGGVIAIGRGLAITGQDLLTKKTGAKIHDAQNGAQSVGANATLHVASGLIPDGGYCAQIGSGGIVDYTMGAAITAANKWLGFYAFKEMAEPPSVLHVYLTGNAFGQFADAFVTIHPGLNFYQIPLPAMLAGLWNVGSGGFTPSASITMRFRDAGYASVTPFTGANVVTVGKVISVGNIYIDPPSKAKFLICYDDCRRDMITPYSGAVGGDGIARPHTVPSMLASYGFRGNFYAIGATIDPLAANFSPLGMSSGGYTYMTANQIKRCRDDYGICIGAHSYSHPTGLTDMAGSLSNTGLRLLGSYGYGIVGATPWTATATGVVNTSTNDYKAILTDLEKGVEILCKAGFPTAADHFALPQGSFDVDVNTALESMGFKTCRGVESIPSPQGGNYCFRGVANPAPPSIALNLIGSYPNTQVEANTRAYVDMVIASGGIGSSYHHTYSDANALAALQILCTVLKEKQNAGLIDVVALDELVFR